MQHLLRMLLVLYRIITPISAPSYPSNSVPLILETSQQNLPELRVTLELAFCRETTSEVESTVP